MLQTITAQNLMVWRAQRGTYNWKIMHFTILTESVILHYMKTLRNILAFCSWILVKAFFSLIFLYQSMQLHKLHFIWNLPVFYVWMLLRGSFPTYDHKPTLIPWSIFLMTMSMISTFLRTQEDHMLLYKGHNLQQSTFFLKSQNNSLCQKLSHCLNNTMMSDYRVTSLTPPHISCL